MPTKNGYQNSQRSSLSPYRAKPVKLVPKETKSSLLRLESRSRSPRCEIFGIFLLSFPQNERKIYKLRQLSLPQFLYFFTKESIL